MEGQQFKRLGGAAELESVTHIDANDAVGTIEEHSHFARLAPDLQLLVFFDDRSIQLVGPTRRRVGLPHNQLDAFGREGEDFAAG